MEFDLTKVATKRRLQEFANELEIISAKVGFKQSSKRMVLST